MAGALPQAPQRLLRDLHVAYIQSLDAKKDGLAYHLTAHLRMGGVYWGLCALELMRAGDTLKRDDVVQFVKSCWDDPARPLARDATAKGKARARDVEGEPASSDGEAAPVSIQSSRRPSARGGFAPYPRHDTHILSTLSALQILAMKDALDAVDRRAVIDYILSLRCTSPHLRGGFYGDSAALEHDTRYLYIALHALTLLGAQEELAALRADSISYIARCYNAGDGGFGTSPGAESHAGQVWVCVAALNILDALPAHTRTSSTPCDAEAHGIDLSRTATWLCERQLPNGGLNGRPQKLEDVCYSWWVLSSLSILGRLHWIDARKLRAFILAAQDPEFGGIADRKDNVADVFHTVFGVAGLSLLVGLDDGGDAAGADPEIAKLQEVDPTYCLPVSVTHRLGIARPYQSFRTERSAAMAQAQA